MTQHHVIVYNGGWMMNIGNAFIDFGARRCLEEVWGRDGVQVHLASAGGNGTVKFMNSGFRRWIGGAQGKGWEPFGLLPFFDASYIVLAGAVLSDEWFQLCGAPLRKAAEESGARIALIGVGLSESAYSNDGIQTARKHVERLNPHVFVSRDQVTFDAFNDIAPHVYNGIDCAFFLSEAYCPPPLTLPEYVVLNFDRLAEPETLPEGLGDLERIRTHHSFWLNFPPHRWPGMKKQYYGMESTLVTDLPYEYLALYASARATLSDRVHACVATLAYGGSAMLYSKSPRSDLFERVGVTTLKDSLTQLDRDTIECEKTKMVEFLRSVL